jgi:RNA recognition motif-containing protein
MFYNENDALSAIEHFNGYCVGNKMLKVKYSKVDNLIKEKSPDLYIKPLPLQVKIENLIEIFSKISKLRSVSIKSTQNYGYNVGFINYYTMFRFFVFLF